MSFNIRKALAPAFTNPMTVIKWAEYRLSRRLNDEDVTDLDTAKRPASVNLSALENAKLNDVVASTLIPRDAAIRLALDYYLNHTLKGEDPAGIYELPFKGQQPNNNPTTTSPIPNSVY
jgi:hypothetical protein